MNERRLDPFTGRSVVIAPGRRGLGAAKPGGLPEARGRCPFCPGHEADTEPTLARWPAHGEWQVRIVANKFPVVTRGTLETSTLATGAHEVGVDARAHDVDLADLPVDHLSAMLTLYRDRVRMHEAQEGIASVILFRNRGRRAGSSQPHPHTQLAALGWVPAEVALRWELARAHLDAHGESVHAASLRRELEEGTRVVSACERVVAHCPFAPSRPFEVRLAPRDPHGGFGTASEEDLAALAFHLSNSGRRLRRAGIVDHNLVLRQPPIGARGSAAAWHLDILPRTGGDAGFEIATGEMIVVVGPEVAAARLRDAM